MAHSMEERLLGNLEKWSCERSQVGVYLNIVVAIELDLGRDDPLGSTTSPADWADVFKEVVSRNPMLCVNIVDQKTGTPRFRRLKQINLGKVLTIEEASSESRELLLEQAFEEEHVKSFVLDSEQPLWRCRLMYFTSLEKDSPWTSLAVVWTVHHAIADGRSSIAFFNSFIDALDAKDRLRTRTASQGLALPSSLKSLPPALESCIDVRLSWTHMTKLVLTQLLLPHRASSLLGLTKNWFHGRQRGPWQLGTMSKTHAKIFRLDAAKVQQLRRHAKTRGVTLSNLLKGCLALAVVRTFGPEAQNMMFCTPVDLRSHLDPPMGEIIGDYVTSVLEYTQLTSEESVWTVSRRFEQAMHDPKIISEAIQYVGGLDYLPKGAGDLLKNPKALSPWESFFTGKIQSSNPRSGTLELSNLGVWSRSSDTRDVSACRPKAIMMSQCVGPIAQLLCCSAATLSGGPLSLVFNWMDGSMTTREAKNVIDEAKTLLLAVIEESDVT